MRSDRGRWCSGTTPRSFSSIRQNRISSRSTRGSGNLYLANPVDESLQALVEDSNLGYLSGIAWSWDGAQLLTWESRKPSEFYVVDRETGEVAVYELPGYFIRTLAFAPDGKVVFDGANQTTAGLFRVGLDDLQPELISGLVESAGSYAWPPDGTHLAYFEADRSAGEARLVVEDESGKGVIATLPIPTGAGSSIPGTANLTWTSDEKALVFEFGQYKTRRAVYLFCSERFRPDEVGQTSTWTGWSGSRPARTRKGDKPGPLRSQFNQSSRNHFQHWLEMVSSR